MKIRSITCFYDPAAPLAAQTLDRLANFRDQASQSFTSAGFEVQTTRLSTTPFPNYVHSPADLPRVAQAMEKEAEGRGFAYLSMGPAAETDLAYFAAIPDAITATRSTFFTAILASPEKGIYLPAVRAAGQIVVRAAAIEPDGFANLRFAALACVRPNGPFFPGSYHTGGRPAFALAMECADAAVSAFAEASTLLQARQGLIDRLEAAAAALTPVAEDLAARFDLDFKGFDFSPAPFPDDCCSLGGAIERLCGTQTGLSGSLAGAAIVADTLDQGRWLRTGFNGLMLPVLEDSVLAARSDSAVLELKDLLMYSAVCGAGLDTVPLPGSATPEQISAVMLDIAALAVRLGKPLTARLMPVPGKEAGQQTTFTFSFFKNGRILKLPAAAIAGLLTGDDYVMLHPRRVNN